MVLPEKSFTGSQERGHRLCSLGRLPGPIASEDAGKILECRISINEDRVVESPVAEQLQRISAQLKAARETAGIELAQVASQTFIPLRLLKAMDEGQFERLPEPVFVQGFIRRYGDAVGLDGKQMAKDFIVDPPSLKKPAEEFLSYHPDDDAPAARNARGGKKQQKMQVPLPPPPAPVPAPVVEPPPVPVAPIAAIAPPPVVEPTPIVAVVESTPTVEPTTAIQSTVETAEPTAETAIEPNSRVEPSLTFDPAANREWSPSADSSGQSGERSSWLYWIGGLLALGLLAIGTVLVMQPKSDAPNSSSSASVNPTIPTTPATPVPSATPKLTAPIVLTVKVVEESWVEVLSDGKSEIAEVLPKGSQKTWTAKESLSITSGNAKGVAYSYNQSPEKLMGTTADPETLVFPPLP
jgi:cytoskeleton protein RodZ